MKSKMSYIGAVFIIAIAVMVYISMNDFLVNIEKSIASYYDQTAFADAFATVKAIPEADLSKLEDVEGIDTVFGRLSVDARLENKDINNIVILHLLAYSPDDKLNKITSDGSLDSISQDSIFIGKKMSKFYNFKPGDKIKLIINGKEKEFTYVSDANEPEYLSARNDGEQSDIAAVDKKTLESLSGKTGTVNELGFTLKNGYKFENVQSALEERLKPYGIEDLCARKSQVSNFDIEAGNAQYASAGTALPVIFVCCSMFMLYIMLKKLVDKDRMLIGTMKAMGAYDNELMVMYMLQAVAIGVLGALIGMFASIPFSRYLYFDDMNSFSLPNPYFSTVFSTRIQMLAITVAACAITVFLAVRDVLKINPADSMRSPEPNVKGKFSLPPLLKKILNLRQVIGLRSIFRNPVRSTVTILAVGVSFGMIANFTAFRVVLYSMYIDIYSTRNTYDADVSFIDSQDKTKITEAFDSLPYINAAEPEGSYTVTYRNKNHTKLGNLTAVEPDSNMFHPLDQMGNAHKIPQSGIMLNSLLAKKLGVSAGDVLEVENTSLSPFAAKMPVVELIDDKTESGGYISLDYLSDAFGCGKTANEVLLTLDKSHIDDLKSALGKSPNISSISESEKERASNEDNYSTVLNMMQLFNFFSVFMGIVMITSITGISVRERKNEFGTLMILGTTENEISEIIIFEHTLDFVAGIILGIPISFVLERVVEKVISSDTFVLQMMVPMKTYVLSFAICLVIMAISTVMVIRNVKRIELTDILKERG